MKIVLIADLHCREIWKYIVEKEKDADKIIFLGDYTCPKEVKVKNPSDICKFLYDVLDFKDKNPNKVVLLRGNHDLASCGYYWAQCYPQDYSEVREYWQTKDIKDWFLKHTQWVYVIPETNIVCSHAGIGQEFLNSCIKKCNSGNKCLLEQISKINELIPSELFGFTDGGSYDVIGDSKTQPCTWIRPYTLLIHGVKDIVHVVGHTPVDHIYNIKEDLTKICKKYNIKNNEEVVESYCDVWCCDNLAKGEYLIIENGEFYPKSIHY